MDNQHRNEWYGPEATTFKKYKDYNLINYQCEGTGICMDYSLFSGIDLIFMDFNCSHTFREPMVNRDILDIRHYRQGRVEFEFQNQKVFHMRENEFCINTLANMPASYSFPFEKCSGVSLVIDRDSIDSSTIHQFSLYGIDIRNLGEHLELDIHWYICKTPENLHHMLGAMICTFGIHNIHQRTNITEGGVIGLMLLIEHWLNISPAYITPVLDTACYALAFKFLGTNFIKLSIISTIFISGFYKIWEQFPPMLSDLSSYPLIAAILGGIFVGVGVGIIVKQGGSSGGDDALALAISHALHWKLSRSYLFTDVVVLVLSVTYIPLTKIIFSLITVTVSSHLIDWIRDYKTKNDHIT